MVVDLRDENGTNAKSGRRVYNRQVVRSRRDMVEFKFTAGHTSKAFRLPYRAIYGIYTISLCLSESREIISLFFMTFKGCSHQKGNCISGDLEGISH